MIIIIVKVMIIISASIIIHELAHLLFSKLLKIAVKEITLGANLLRVRYKKLTISPFLFIGDVRTTIQELNKHSMSKVVIFFMSGAFINLLLCFFFYFFASSIITKMFGIMVNAPMFVLSIMPFVRNSDLWQLLQYMKIRYDNN